MKFTFVFAILLSFRESPVDAFVRNLNPISHNIMSANCGYSTTASFSSKQNHKSGVNSAFGDISPKSIKTDESSTSGDAGAEELVGTGGFFDVNQGDFDVTKKSIEFESEQRKKIDGDTMSKGNHDVKNPVDLDLHNNNDKFQEAGSTQTDLSPQTRKEPADGVDVSQTMKNSVPTRDVELKDTAKDLSSHGSGPLHLIPDDHVGNVRVDYNEVYTQVKGVVSGHPQAWRDESMARLTPDDMFGRVKMRPGDFVDVPEKAFRSRPKYKNDRSSNVSPDNYVDKIHLGYKVTYTQINEANAHPSKVWTAGKYKDDSFSNVTPDKYVDKVHLGHKVTYTQINEASAHPSEVLTAGKYKDDGFSIVTPDEYVDKVHLGHKVTNTQINEASAHPSKVWTAGLANLPTDDLFNKAKTNPENSIYRIEKGAGEKKTTTYSHLDVDDPHGKVGADITEDFLYAYEEGDRLRPKDDDMTFLSPDIPGSKAEVKLQDSAVYKYGTGVHPRTNMPGSGFSTFSPDDTADQTNVNLQGSVYVHKTKSQVDREKDADSQESSEFLSADGDDMNVEEEQLEFEDAVEEEEEYEEEEYDTRFVPYTTALSDQVSDIKGQFIFKCLFDQDNSHTWINRRSLPRYTKLFKDDNKQAEPFESADESTGTTTFESTDFVYLRNVRLPEFNTSTRSVDKKVKAYVLDDRPDIECDIIFGRTFLDPFGIDIPNAEK